MRRASLKWILFMAFLPVALLPVLVVGLTLRWQFSADAAFVERRIQEDLLQVGTTRVGLIERLFANARASARIMAEAWPHTLHNMSGNDALQALNRGGIFLRVRVVAQDGLVLASTVGDRGKRLPRWEPGRGELVQVVRHPGTGSVVRFIEPVAGGRYLVATYPLQAVQQAITSHLALTLDRPSFLVGSDGLVLAHPDPELLSPPRSMRSEPPVQRALAGASGTMRYEDAAGRGRSAFYAPVPVIGGALVATQPAATTMVAPPMVANQATLLALGGGILLAVLITFALSRGLARPTEEMEQALQHMAANLDLDRPLPPFPAISSRVLEHDRLMDSTRELYRALSTALQELAARRGELTVTNQQLAETVARLKQLDALKANFLNVMSHDLRLPLTAILGYVELLQDMEIAGLGPEERRYLDQVVESCARMGRMLDELLEHARAEVGRIVLRPVIVEPELLLSEAVYLFHSLASQKGLKLELQLPTALPLVEADPDRVRQILANLLSNAVKYTPRGGSVCVRAAAHPGELEISVSDSGIGLSPADQSQLFTPFFRSERPEVQRERGTGIGLANTRAMIEAHQGRIEVASEEGRGTTFTVRLPALPVELNAATPEA